MPAATTTISVSSRLIAAPIAPLSNWCCVSGISARLNSGLMIVVTPITHVQVACRFMAIKTWLSMMFMYIAGMQRPRIAITGTDSA